MDSEETMDWTGCKLVEVVPGKVSGVPILKHSRVPADAVVESYELGESVEDIAYSYSLKAEDIRKVLAFAQTRVLAKPSA
jgi:uncharacterized protein (DUF433 family)